MIKNPSIQSELFEPDTFETNSVFGEMQQFLDQKQELKEKQSRDPEIRKNKKLAKMRKL